MTLGHYGIPQSEVALGALQEQVQMNGHALSETARAAILPAIQTLSDNGGALQAIQNTLRRSLSGRVGGNTRRLNGITDTLQQAATSAVGAVASGLAGVASLPPIPASGSQGPQPISTPTPPSGTEPPLIGEPRDVWYIMCPPDTVLPSGNTYPNINSYHLPGETPPDPSQRCSTFAAGPFQTWRDAYNYWQANHQALVDCCHIIPTPLPWWCTQDSGGVMHCVQASARPPNTVSGPYPTLGDCQNACSPTPLKWYCYQPAIGGPDCGQFQAPPPGVISGPYDTQSECNNACNIIPTPLPYWCVQLGATGPTTCIQSATRPPGTIAGGGPFQSQTQCQTFCSLPPPPPPPPPPPNLCCEHPVGESCEHPVFFKQCAVVQVDQPWGKTPSSKFFTSIPDPVRLFSSVNEPVYVNITNLPVLGGPPPPPPPILPPPPPPPTPSGECPEGMQLVNGVCVPQEEVPQLVNIPSLSGCGLAPDGSLPAVGSREWCNCIEALLKYFSSVGNSALAFMVPGGVGSKDFASSILKSIQCPFGIGPFTVDVCVQVGKEITDAFNVAWQTVNQLVNQGVPGKATVFLGLALVRAVTRVFKRMRLGTDFAIWATLDIDIGLAPLEHIIDMLQRYILPTNVPGIPEAIECSLFNTALDEQINCWMKLDGGDPGVWDAVKDSRREKLTAQEVIESARRRGASIVDQIDTLREYGWIRPAEATRKVELYDKIPTIADFLHYLQRNVFDVSYVTTYNLLDGFEERYWANFGPQLQAIGITKERSQLDYAAHWILPPPTQLQEFVYRLRPDKQGVQNPVTTTDYQRLLAEQDVAPWARPRYAEILYRVPALGYVQNMFRNYVLSPDELKSIHQDLGYSPQDSDRFVAVDTLMRSRIRASEAHGWTAGAAAQAYAANVLSAFDAVAKIRTLGFTAQEATDALARAQADLQRQIFIRARSRIQLKTVTIIQQGIEAGVLGHQDAVNALTNLNWTTDQAEGFVTVLESGARIKDVKEVKGRLKRAFLSGEIDAAYAQQSLSSLGLVADSVTQTLLVWTAELTPNRRRRSARQIVSDVAVGEMSTAEALVRLTNLGYEAPDQALFLADSAAAIAKREQSSFAVEFRTEQQLANTLEQQIVSGGKQSQQLRDRLRRFAPPSKLDKWAALGLISFADYASKLTIYGYNDETIKLSWETACSGSKATCQGSTTPATSAPSSGNGQG